MVLLALLDPSSCPDLGSRPRAYIASSPLQHTGQLLSGSPPSVPQSRAEVLWHAQVTVVDASQFLSTLGSHDSVAEAGLVPCGVDARTLAHLLIDQVSPHPSGEVHTASGRRMPKRGCRMHTSVGSTARRLPCPKLMAIL